jgi:hypothetical protein
VVTASSERRVDAVHDFEHRVELRDGEEWKQNPTFQWTVPGNVLRDYVIDADSATAIPLGNAHDGTEQTPLNGKSQSLIKYLRSSCECYAISIHEQ